jgi:hypothetical protein
MRYLLALILLVPAAAQSAPVANLALSCPTESAIGQAGLDSCRGYAYQLPTIDRIVASGSNQTHFWRRAGDLVGADTVLVCTIPVEPGKYSSCRDAAGVRRTAFVRKDSIMGGGSVTVDKTGADYNDPVTAAQNAFAGDTWCVAPQWPSQPCVMAIGDGVFVLKETLNIPEGLVVAGAGKGATLLVADNGVETAVSSSGAVRISDLTIVNSKPGMARTTGLIAGGRDEQKLVQLHDVAIHVAAAAKNVAIVKRQWLELLDSEIAAVGPSSIGISNLDVEQSSVTLERSRVLAELAIEEDGSRGLLMRLVDSHLSGSVLILTEGVTLEIARSVVLGDVGAENEGVRFVITDSTIKGRVSNRSFGGHSLRITNSSVGGGILFGFGGIHVDGLTLQGELAVFGAQGTVVRSRISSAGTRAALSLGQDAGYASSIQLEHTFVEGVHAVDVGEDSELQSSSSILAGPVSGDAAAVLRCTDTLGADFELLSAACQPQSP